MVWSFLNYETPYIFWFTNNLKFADILRVPKPSPKYRYHVGGCQAKLILIMIIVKSSPSKDTFYYLPSTSVTKAEVITSVTFGYNFKALNYSI